jgi:hypothetical protein
MENRWLFEGAERDFFEVLPSKTADIMIDGFERYRNLFDDDEYIRAEQVYQKSNIPGVLNLMIPKTTYFVNLKRASITLLTFILDLTLTDGFASTVLGLAGYSTQAIVKLSEENAEKCIYMNLYKQENHTGSSSMLSSPQNQSCPNHDLRCKYRKDAKCTMPEEAVAATLKSLSEKNVISRTRDATCYKCNL